MSSAQTILELTAADGSFDSTDADAWPKTLQHILDRLAEIVADFPKPSLTPPPVPANQSSGYGPGGEASSQASQIANASQETQPDKENARPATPTRPPVPAFAATPPPSPAPETQGYPPETVALYNSIRISLSKNFPKKPPHTIQRLAELILEPKRHYRFVHPYLRALDRVVSVSSPCTAFPLPPALLNPNASSMVNGATTTPSLPLLGSDESLGGALLTPIPWLQGRGAQSELVSESTEMVDGPNGAGRIETVSVVNGQLSSLPQHHQPQIASTHPDGETLPSTGPVTQGELLRQEQEAGVTLLNPHSIQPNRTIIGEMEGGGNVMETMEGEEEVPHARGPDVIGMEDTGPQRSTGELNIEGAVGRPMQAKSPSKSPEPADAVTSPGTGSSASVEGNMGAETRGEEMKEESKPSVDGDGKNEEGKDTGA